MVSALKEIMVSDRRSHEKSKIAFSVELEENLKTLTKGLKGTTWYKERVVHGKALYDQQRIRPVLSISKIVSFFLSPFYYLNYSTCNLVRENPGIERKTG